MGVLYIRDQDGNFVPIRAIRGADGKSAYEQAVEGGYAGTEEEFIALLNGLTTATPAPVSVSEADSEHITDYDNPHKVTAAQVGLGNVDNTSDMNKPVSNAVNAKLAEITGNITSHKDASNPHGITPSLIGAIPAAYSVSTDLNNELQGGGSKMTVCSYNSSTKNTPKTQSLTTCAHGMVITNAYTDQYGVQICMPSGDSHMYIRKKDTSGISSWAKVCNTGDIPTIPKVSSVGTYTGSGTAGSDNPCSLTFDEIPKFVVIMAPNASYIGFFLKGVNQYLVASANGFSTSGNECTWSGKTLNWHTLSSGQYYQLNAGTQKYTYYVAY